MEMSFKEVGAILGQQAQGEGEVCHFAVDSRAANSRTLFFALAGEKTDGHRFLADVKGQGGRAAVVAESYRGASHGLTLFPVPNVIEALHSLARAAYQKRSAPVVAVTGTVGKTTVKEFIATLLKERFQVAKTPGNANSQLGVPLFLLNDAGEADLYVIEMGMSFPGELTRLVSLAPPSIGVLTQVSLAHAENFSSLEEIAAAKSELFQGPHLQRGFFCAQTLNFPPVAELKCDKVVYSCARGRGDYSAALASSGVFVYERGIKSPLLPLKFRETHFVENALGALAVARDFGLSWEEIARALEALCPQRHRFEKVVIQGVLYIDDSYNASPQAMLAALANLPSTRGKKIAVLGAMKELGLFSEASHREVGRVAAEHVDCLFCLGEECKPLIEAFKKSGKPAYLVDELALLKDQVPSIARAGDVVLIKGSCSLKMWELLSRA